jgi:hypothetical protein
MLRYPMPGNILTPGDPNAVVPGHMVEDAMECADPAGPAQQASVEADGHHLRVICPSA